MVSKLYSQCTILPIKLMSPLLCPPSPIHVCSVPKRKSRSLCASDRPTAAPPPAIPRPRPSDDATPPEKSHAAALFPLSRFQPPSHRSVAFSKVTLWIGVVSRGEMGVNKTALKSPSGLLKIVALVRKMDVLEGQNSADFLRFASS